MVPLPAVARLCLRGRDARPAQELDRPTRVQMIANDS